VAAQESTGTIGIIYQDRDIVVVDKPPAMLTHSNSFDRNSPTVLAVMGSRMGQSVRTVHRLDRMTTGVMILALTKDAAGALSEQFREREVEKRYIAIARGHLDPEGRIESPMSDARNEEERIAVTEYQTIATGRIREQIGRYGEGWFSLVDLSLLTGRSHQARRHLHRINHPVLGDQKHGDKNYNRWAESRLGERHLYLRARELHFTHPSTGKRMVVSVGMPTLWLRCLAAVGIHPPVRYTQLPSVYEK
jgi:tRNA pseudouridine65 synthase